ncbi:hypothetical protein P3S67_013304 [Capsicum chacoense]
MRVKNIMDVRLSSIMLENGSQKHHGSVLGVTKRLIQHVRDGLEFDTYGLWDIILFGNAKRMEIDDHEDLFDVLLNTRVRTLSSSSYEAIPTVLKRRRSSRKA